MSTELQIAAACVASYLLGFAHSHLIAKDRAREAEVQKPEFAINVPPPPTIEDKINEIRLAFPDAVVRKAQYSWTAMLGKTQYECAMSLTNDLSISAWAAWELLYIRLKNENII